MSYSVSHQIKASNVSGTKIYLQRFPEIYKHSLSKWFKNAVLVHLEMVIVLSELRFVKWVTFFEQYCVVKWVIFIASFCWLWDFLLENLLLKDKIQIWDFESFTFWFKFGFLVTILGHFSRSNFKTFCRRQTMVANIFIQPPPFPISP